MPYWDHKIPNTRPYRADEGQEKREKQFRFSLFLVQKSLYLVFFPFLNGFGPNFLRGRPLSLLEDLRLGWLSG